MQKQNKTETITLLCLICKRQVWKYKKTQEWKRLFAIRVWISTQEMYVTWFLKNEIGVLYVCDLVVGFGFSNTLVSIPAISVTSSVKSCKIPVF